jgi:membrane protease YdiL (CAAX protease family)
VAVLSAMGHKARTGSPVPSYITTLIWQWALFALVLWGMWRKGLKPRDVMGKPWRSFDDVLMDLVWAAGFFIGSRIVLAVVVVTVMQLAKLPADTFTLKKSVEAVGSLAPNSAIEIVMWIGLSITAGIVEEFVFRGYLQRQLIALTRNAAVGIALCAVIFGFAHAYQGGTQMIIITALGALFGILAYWRQNLKPGMIAHAGQDIFAGIAVGWIARHLTT